MNIGELTAMIGADIRDLKTSVSQANKIMSGYASQVDSKLKKSDQDWKTSAGVVNTQTKKMQSDIKRTSTSMQSMKKHALGLRSALSLIGSAMVLKNLFDVGKEVSMLNISFEAVFGSAQKAASEMAYVKKVSDDMGQNLYVVAKQFKGLSAAAMNTVMEGQGVHDIFRAITKASASLGLSSYETEGALYAVQQMISKGTVQSEELRGQLGERLPGAFRMAAEAMGMTQKELGKALEMGQIMATDMLPKLARVLEATFTGKVSKAVAASNKLAEGWKTLRWNIAKSGFLDEAADSVMSLAKSLDTPAMKESLAEVGTGLGDIIKNLRPLIPLVGDLTKALAGVAGALGSIGNVYSSLPSDVTTGISAGIVVRILTGSTGVGAVVAMLVEFNSAMEAFNNTFGDIYPSIQGFERDMVRFDGYLDAIIEKFDHKYQIKMVVDWDAEHPDKMMFEQKVDMSAYFKNKEEIKSAKAIADDKATPGRTKKEILAERAFYKELNKLSGTSYEKELEELKITEQVNKNILSNKLDAHKMFLLQKQALDDKYNESRALVSAKKIAMEAEWASVFKESTSTTTEFALYEQDKAYKDWLSKGADKKQAQKWNEIERQKIIDASNADVIAKQVEFWDEYDQLIMTDYQYQKQILDAKYVDEATYIDDKTALNKKYNAALQELQDQELEIKKESTDAMADYIAQYKEQATDVVGNTEKVWSNAFDGLTDTLSDFISTGKASWSDLEQSIIKSITNITTQYLLSQTLMGGASSGGGTGIFGSLISMGMGFFGGGTSDVSGLGTQGSAYGGMDSADIMASIHHSGGVIGADRGGQRAMPAATFSGAQRFHEGLLPDEFPAILQKKEGVFTPAQMAALGENSSTGTQQVTKVTNNFYIKPDVRGNISEKSQRQIAGSVSRTLGRH